MYRNKPNPDNERCRDGLALGLGFYQNAGFVSKHIGLHCTTEKKRVNPFERKSTHWKQLTTHSGNSNFFLSAYAP
jgi:hypothetical protein